MSKQNREQNRTARAAAVVAQQKRSERNRKLAITGAIVAVIAVVIAGGVWFSIGSSSSDASTGGKTPPAKVDGTSLVVGSDSAATKVTVYEDFQCPYCRQFENASRDFLREAADDGKAQITYKPFNLLTQDDYSARALSAWATVLQKGTPAQALNFHDQLFDHQPYENASDKPDTAKLQDWAKDAGVKSSSVLGAFKSIDSGYVKEVTQAAVSAGVQGTPTILANGKPVGGSSVSAQADQLEETINKG